MAESSSAVCTICFEAVQDGRLLHCLHTFCKGCLDDLDMRTGHKHEVTCPTCRSTCTLPESGAAGLPKDITVAIDTTSQCHACSTEHGDGQPELFCTTCDVAFCKEHAFAHVMATEHSVGPIASNAASPSSRGTTSFTRLCHEHGLPAKYLCQQCNIAVCAECVAFGGHHRHKPIVALKEIAKLLKKSVRRQTDHLKNVRLPSSQSSLSAVEVVSTELSSRAENIRTHIRASAKRVHDAVDLVMQQKLTEVDDLEDLRLKHLNSQHDQIKRHSESLESAIGFGEKLMEKEEETEEVGELLLAVEKRADELDEAVVAAQPVEHARVDFESVSEETLMAKMNELVGVVLPRNASAKHSFVQGDTNKLCKEDSSVSFVVVAKDNRDHRLESGGDVIRAESRATSTDPCPIVDVVDNKNGTYTITITAKRHGDCSFAVFMNNEKLPEHLSVTCCSALPFTFDPIECQTENTISGDKFTVTRTGRGQWSSVLGSVGMKTGQHVWKVKITKSSYMFVFLGVAEKPQLTKNRNNYRLSYSWDGADGDKWIRGNSGRSMSRWQENDVLQLQLDCFKHTLSIKNFRSEEMATIHSLPPTELFAYFATGSPGDCLTLC